MQQQQITEEKLRDASALVSRHLGLEVVDAAVHGSVLRGFNDPNSDIDVCFLINRPVSDFIRPNNVSPYFDGSTEERRKKAALLSSQMTRELGWQIMVTLLDMRTLMLGIMSSSPFSLLAYESLSKQGSLVSDLFDDPARRFFNTSNLVYRCGEQVRSGMKNHLAVKQPGTEFKQERTFLGTLWSAHRLLAYISGDRQHCRSIQDLMRFNEHSEWGDRLPEGFDPLVIGVLKARTERSPFDMPLGVSQGAADLLRKFVDGALAAATNYLRENPTKNPSLMDETNELVDLYGLLLDHGSVNRHQSRNQGSEHEFRAAAA